MTEKILKVRKFNLLMIGVAILFMISHIINTNYYSAMGFALTIGAFLGSKCIIDILENGGE